jgi:hypothetical protein
MTKALLGSSKQAVCSVNRILQRRNNPAFLADRDGAEPIPLWAKDMDGVKTLELQPLGTVRRKGIGTFAQPSTQEERSVCAPASGGRGLCLPAAPGKRRGR